MTQTPPLDSEAFDELLQRDITDPKTTAYLLDLIGHHCATALDDASADSPSAPLSAPAQDALTQLKTDFPVSTVAANTPPPASSTLSHTPAPARFDTPPSHVVPPVSVPHPPSPATPTPRATRPSLLKTFFNRLVTAINPFSPPPSSPPVKTVSADTAIEGLKEREKKINEMLKQKEGNIT